MSRVTSTRRGKPNNGGRLTAVPGCGHPGGELAVLLPTVSFSYGRKTHALQLPHLPVEVLATVRLHRSERGTRAHHDVNFPGTVTMVPFNHVRFDQADTKSSGP